MPPDAVRRGYMRQLQYGRSEAAWAAAAHQRRGSGLRDALASRGRLGQAGSRPQCAASKLAEHR